MDTTQHQTAFNYTRRRKSQIRAVLVKRGAKLNNQSDLDEKRFFKRFIAQKIQRDTQGYKIVPF
jgi:hypothetical protein